MLASFFTRGHFFTNVFLLDQNYELRRLYLLVLNLLIGAKVAVGFVSLFYIFIEEGNN
jgi:multicomponent Na+:H+ antiporter subunit B